MELHWVVRLSSPFYLHPNSQMPAHFTVRAIADTGYDYFLKQYLLTGDQRIKTQWAFTLGAHPIPEVEISRTRELYQSAAGLDTDVMCFTQWVGLGH